MTKITKIIYSLKQTRQNQIEPKLPKDPIMNVSKLVEIYNAQPF
ncbi:protein of unknown function [Cardinium endosymbiont cEper1 of Encarsia pergandiella]|nr:protein of unknown function [Cardinium endosymbiont cEper1 of Encarsia pergandiella]